MSSKVERRARKAHRDRIAYEERLQAQMDRERSHPDVPADETDITQLSLKLTGKAPMPLKKHQRPMTPEAKEREIDSIIQYLREDEANGKSC